MRKSIEPNINSKINSLKEQFSKIAHASEMIYREIIRWGETPPPFQEEWRSEDNRVTGCQSLMYLHTECRGGKMHFWAASDALISSGLAAILISVYQGESPEEILKSPPTFLEEIGIPKALSPGRANGLASLYIKIKQACLHSLISTVN